MVAEATLIAETIKGTERFYSPVFLVFLKQERGIVDIGLCDGITQHRTYQHMVDALPTAFVTVGSLSAMSALGLTGHVMEPVFLQEQEGRTIGIVVEVASDDDSCISGQKADGIQEVAGGHFETEGEDALRLLYFAMDDLEANPQNLPFLQAVVSNVDGEIADCKDALLHFKVR